MQPETITKPYLITFDAIGSSDLGYITSIQYPDAIPFPVKRVYWTYFTPHNVERGHHAHYDLQQIIIAVCGIIRFHIEGPGGSKSEFVLDNPNVGLYLPPMHWRTIHFSHTAVLLCLASQEYQVEDYIRDYDEFKRLAGPKD